MGARSTKPVVGEIFELLDPNKSGFLEPGEYTQLVHFIHQDKALESIKFPELKQIDIDGDEKVSLEELSQFFAKIKIAEQQLLLMKEAIVNVLDAPYANEPNQYDSGDGEEEEDSDADFKAPHEYIRMSPSRLSNASLFTAQAKEGDDYDGHTEDGDEKSTNLGKAAAAAKRTIPKQKRKEHHIRSTKEKKTTTGSDSKDDREGFVWHAQILQDNYKNSKHCFPSGQLKLRRQRPQIKGTDFFAKLMSVKDQKNDKEGGEYWIFKSLDGGLNGWGGLNYLQLRSITYKEKGMLGNRIIRAWDSSNYAVKRRSSPARRKNKGKAKVIQSQPHPPTPEFPVEAAKNGLSVRATLVSPSWSKKGWTQDSPGHFWWYFACREASKRRVGIGTKMIRNLRNYLIREHESEPIAVRIHHFAHRYSYKRAETIKDQLVYHAGVLVEWDHRQYCTVFELGFLNGVSGYGGKSNWVVDKNAKPPGLYRAMPGCKDSWDLMKEL